MEKDELAKTGVDAEGLPRKGRLTALVAICGCLAGVMTVPAWIEARKSRILAQKAIQFSANATTEANKVASEAFELSRRAERALSEQKLLESKVVLKADLQEGRSSWLISPVSDEMEVQTVRMLYTIHHWGPRIYVSPLFMDDYSTDFSAVGGSLEHWGRMGVLVQPVPGQEYSYSKPFPSHFPILLDTSYVHKTRVERSVGLYIVDFKWIRGNESPQPLGMRFVRHLDVDKHEFWEESFSSFVSALNEWGEECFFEWAKLDTALPKSG